MSPAPVDPRFERALATVFRLEGGDKFTDDPVDRGGATRFGISLAYLRNLGADRGGDLDADGDVDARDVILVTPEKARALYWRDFWIPSGAADVALLSEELATEVFEFAVVAGPGRAVRALQRSIVGCGERIEVDGGYGEQTHDALERIAERDDLPEVTLRFYRECARHFYNVVKSDRSQIRFLLGWMKRALNFEEEAA